MGLKIKQKISIETSYDDDPASGGYLLPLTEYEITSYTKYFCGRMTIPANSTNVDLPIGSITNVKYLFVKPMGSLKIKFNGSAFILFSSMNLANADLTNVKFSNDTTQAADLHFFVAGT